VTVLDVPRRSPPWARRCGPVARRHVDVDRGGHAAGPSSPSGKGAAPAPPGVTATCARGVNVPTRKLSKDQRRLAQELADSMTEDNLRTDESFIGKLKRLLG
jgi:hypothetical protein